MTAPPATGLTPLEQALAAENRELRRRLKRWSNRYQEMKQSRDHHRDRAASWAARARGKGR